MSDKALIPVARAARALITLPASTVSVITSAVTTAVDLLAESRRLRAEDRRHERELALERERLQAQARQAAAQLVAGHAARMAEIHARDQAAARRDERLERALDEHARDSDATREALLALATAADAGFDTRLQACERLLQHRSQAAAERWQLIDAPQRGR